MLFGNLIGPTSLASCALPFAQLDNSGVNRWMIHERLLSSKNSNGCVQN
jgi:hypothetical protein